MGCCGKEKNIATGYSKYLGNIDFVLGETREGVCRECEQHTWLSPKTYIKYLLKHNVKIIINFDKLDTLPPLPKQEYKKNEKLFCRICKCFIPVKARVQNEKCPLDKWSN